jgi:hypothetical protein
MHTSCTVCNNSTLYAQQLLNCPTHGGGMDSSWLPWLQARHMRLQSALTRVLQPTGAALLVEGRGRPRVPPHPPSAWLHADIPVHTHSFPPNWKRVGFLSEPNTPETLPSTQQNSTTITQHSACCLSQLPQALAHTQGSTWLSQDVRLCMAGEECSPVGAAPSWEEAADPCSDPSPSCPAPGPLGSGP